MSVALVNGKDASAVVTCVQCSAAFDPKLNGEGHCAFHTGYRQGRSWTCCGKGEPCQRNVHKAEHHCEWPYAAFFEFYRGIAGYCNTQDTWAELSLLNYDTNEREQVSVGHLLRWSTKTSSVAEQNLLVVAVGRVYNGGSYHFHVYTEKQLDAVGQSGEADVLIYRTSDKHSEYAEARWLVDTDTQMVRGIRLEAKVACFEKASITEVEFSPFPLKKGEVKEVQRSGLVELRAATQAQLPAPFSNAPDGAIPDLSELPSRAARDDFPTLDRITQDGSLIISQSTPLQVNNGRFTQRGHDAFGFALSLFNASAAGSAVLVSLSAEFKLLNSDGWWPAEAVRYDYDQSPFPMGVTAGSKAVVSGSVVVPHWFGENEAGVDGKEHAAWRGVSYVARHKPLRLRFTVTDAKGKTASRIVEWVNKVPSLSTPAERDTLFLHLDDADELERHVSRFTSKPEGESQLVSGDFSWTPEEARKVVYQAQKNGISEVELKDHSREAEQLVKRYFALVDTARSVAYAIKVQLVLPRNNLAVQGYVRLPFYGPKDAERVEAKAAQEVAELPQLKETLPTVGDLFDIEDRGLDDLSEEDLQQSGSNGGASGSASGGGANVDLSAIQEQLTSLNANVARVADALEKLVALQSNK